jgi:nitric oxide reductase NorD protein
MRYAALEMLHAQRTRLRKQLDGDELDLETYIDSHADFRAGCRWHRRCISPVVVRNGTWPSCCSSTHAHRRLDFRQPTGIDVEREALLLVCIALDEMASRIRAGFPGKGRVL